MVIGIRAISCDNTQLDVSIAALFHWDLYKVEFSNGDNVGSNSIKQTRIKWKIMHIEIDSPV